MLFNKITLSLNNGLDAALEATTFLDQLVLNHVGYVPKGGFQWVFGIVRLLL